MDVRRQGQQPNERAMGEVPQAPAVRRQSRGDSLYRAGIASVIVIAAVLLLAGLWRVYTLATANAVVQTNKYQALFLTNGQVYFGKLTHIDSDYVELTDIFYLQVQQQVQPGSSSTSSSSSSNNPQVSLAKLGGELHGPEDEMFVAKQQVLFWENLKPSGKVSQAIAQYNSGGK